jgi:hypothetical protein
VATELGALLDRHTRLFFLYTGGALMYCNYPEQLEEAFPALAPRLRELGRVELWPEVDHTFTRREDRDRLLERVARWLDESFPAQVRHG